MLPLRAITNTDKDCPRLEGRKPPSTTQLFASMAARSDVDALPDGIEASVVLPAGGIGLRTGANIPKQYWEVFGKPILYYTLRVFEDISWIQNVVVAVKEERLEWITDVAASQWMLTKCTFVAGGETRHRSIKKGLEGLQPLLLGGADEANHVVIIHDAVRPFVSEEVLRSVAIAANSHGAAGTTLPLVSTVIRVNSEGFLDKSLDRSQYQASQTPQAFKNHVICTAYDSCTKHDFDHGTECLHLAQKYAGKSAKLVQATPDVWKITYKPDLYTAEQMLKTSLRQVALVTGGSRGIGKEVTIGLRGKGLQVAIVARTESEVKAVAEETGSFAIVGDVSNPKDVARIFKSVVEKFGRIDIVVNNAGTAVKSKIEEMDDETWHSVIEGNLSSTFYCSREAMKYMRGARRGGVIVNVGSSSVSGGRSEQGAYAASKAGIQTLTETLAIEGKEHEIYSYCIIPRRTATSLRERLYPEEDPSICLEPQNVANIIVSTCTEWNPWLTGQSFWVR